MIEFIVVPHVNRKIENMIKIELILKIMYIEIDFLWEFFELAFRDKSRLTSLSADLPPSVPSGSDEQDLF